MSTNRLLLGVLAGVAAGTLIGVLFAPDKGTETRKKISQKRDDFTGAIKDKVNSFVEGVSSSFGSARDEAEALVDAGKEKAEQLKGRVEDHVKRELKTS